MSEIIPIFEVSDYPTYIQRGVEALSAGKIVVLPTETVYGAAALLSSAQGKQHLRALRGGEQARAFTVHLARPADASQYIGDVGALGRRMIRKLWPGPVALMFDVPPDRRKQVAVEHNVEESDLYNNGSIMLRCPDHIVATDLLTAVNGPVALTKAGSGERAPSAQELDNKAELIFDAGPSRFSKPSTIVRLLPAEPGKPQKYEIVRTGIYDARIIERLLTTMVLFVCSGNTCRSPMAEAIARRIIAKKLQIADEQIESRGISVVSAGSFAMPGSRATPAAVDALKEIGADLSRHRSRPLSVELIHQADFIYAMGRSHAQAITSLVPSAAEKTTTLDPSGDIDDPIGGDVDLYKDLAQHLTGLIEKRLAEKVLAPGE